MKVLEQMALFVHQRDEKNNVAIAERIASSENTQELRQIISLLQEGNSALKNDCIKIVYEIGNRKPHLIESFLPLFIHLLQSKNNRLQWGAMCAISHCAKSSPKAVFKNLIEILESTRNGSIICTDYKVQTLIELSKNKSCAKKTIPLLLEELWFCPENQFPMYCEKSLALGKSFIQKILLPLLVERLTGISTPSKKKRLLKIIKKYGHKKQLK